MIIGKNEEGTEYNSFYKMNYKRLLKITNFCMQTFELFKTLMLKCLYRQNK